jgi:cytochrome P450 family 13
VTIDWLEKANSNSDSAGFNIHYYFQEFTMDVIARVAMGQEGSRQFDNELTDFSREIFGQVGLDSRLFYYSSIWPQFRGFWRKFVSLAAKVRHDPFSAMRTKVTEEVAKRKKERVGP